MPTCMACIFILRVQTCSYYVLSTVYTQPIISDQLRNTQLPQPQTNAVPSDANPLRADIFELFPNS